MVEGLELVTLYFDGKAVFVRQVGSWMAGWEKKVQRVVHASHSEKGDGMVRWSCCCSALWGSSNQRVLDSIREVG